LALRRCALIHRHRPDLIDWDRLDKVRVCLTFNLDGSFGHYLLTSTQSDAAGNTQTAFDIASKHLGIPVSFRIPPFPVAQQLKLNTFCSCSNFSKSRISAGRRYLMSDPVSPPSATFLSQGILLNVSPVVITYVAEFFHAFSSLDKAEVTTRRVEKFATMLNGLQ
jgi:hypothetical protein